MEKTDFKALVERYGKAVLNTAVRIVRDTQTAQDVHQEVFFEIWRRWHKFNGRTNWGAYLYRMTVRRALGVAKQRLREGKQLGLQDDPVTEKERPDGPIITAELQQALLERLGRLPKLQAEAFVLSRIEGLERRKVAEILGCSYEAAGVHLHRAMKRLARELAGHFNR